MRVFGKSKSFAFGEGRGQAYGVIEIEKINKKIEMIRIDVVCPLYRAEELIDEFLKRLDEQKNVQIENAVFPITKSEKYEEVAEKIKAHGFTYFLVEKEDFSHSLTRERAIKEYCTSDVVLMLSQDVILHDENAASILCSAVNEKVAYAYGRQICKKRTIEKYVRDKNYGKQSHTVTKADIEKMQIDAFFSSDAFSAYYRPVFLQLNGYDGLHMMMSEDMYYARKVLEADYEKAYVAEAIVEHSHNLTFRQLHDRYYAIGEWFTQNNQFEGYEKENSAFKLALYVFGRALRGFNIPVLIRFLPDMMARYIGMKKGQRSAKRANKEKKESTKS